MITLEQIKTLNEQLAKTKKDIAEYLKSNTVSDEEKWTILTELDVSLLPRGRCYVDYPELLKNNIECCDLYFERYETIDVIEKIYDRVIEGKEGEEPKFQNVNLEKLKKDIIAEGIRTFIYDW
jgi:hypothetical protein